MLVIYCPMRFQTNWEIQFTFGNNAKWLTLNTIERIGVAAGRSFLLCTVTANAAANYLRFLL